MKHDTFTENTTLENTIGKNTISKGTLNSETEEGERVLICFMFDDGPTQEEDECVIKIHEEAMVPSEEEEDWMLLEVIKKELDMTKYNHDENKEDKTDSFKRNVKYFSDIKGGGDLEHLSNIALCANIN